MPDTTDASTNKGGFFGKTPVGIAANVGCLLLVVVVITLIALPGNRKFEDRARQSEAKTNLKAIYVSSKAYFAEMDHFPSDGKQLSWLPAEGNRYNYFLFPEGRSLPAESRATAFARDAAPFAHVPPDTTKHADAPVFERYTDTNCTLTRAKFADGTPASLGRSVHANEEIYTALAIANVDRDDKLDCWSISTAERTAADGTVIAPGDVFAESDDVAK